MRCYTPLQMTYFTDDNSEVYRQCLHIMTTTSAEKVKADFTFFQAVPFVQITEDFINKQKGRDRGSL